GGDFELCYALILSGWKLWYDPRLHIRHFMPSARLTWENLEKLNYGFGQQSVVFDAYQQKPLKPWWWEALIAWTFLLRHPSSKLNPRDSISLLRLSQKGRLQALLTNRRAYNQRRRLIKSTLN
ncbi:MAG: hypothetical protein ACQKBV_07740, partial [Puniceicoccales bacterium]